MEACASDLGDASHITCLVIVFFSFAQNRELNTKKIRLYSIYRSCAVHFMHIYCSQVRSCDVIQTLAAKDVNTAVMLIVFIFPRQNFQKTYFLPCVSPGSSAIGPMHFLVGWHKSRLKQALVLLFCLCMIFV